MSKVTKRRPCPAVQREITSAECGEHRVSRYACPADCPHNPFAPANYSQFLEIEEVLDKKTIGRLLEDTKDRHTLEHGFQRALQADTPHEMHAHVEWHFFFKRDEGGLTCAQRWEHAGFPGLKNDERVLLRAKMQTRVALLEVHRILDGERTEAVDLLDPVGPPIVIKDRSLASMAVRFAPLVGWVYPLPHYWRLSGTVIVIQEMAPFEPREIVAELAKHLGGPTAAPELRLWLAEHFVRFDNALHAVGLARRERMFASLDARFGKLVYELKAPLPECRAALDAGPDTDEDELADVERREGFSEARVWFDDETEPIHALPDGGRLVLGRVLLGQSHWRVETMGTAKLARLRQHFEARLGPRVQFVGERIDDVAAQVVGRGPAYDQALVPPRLLEHLPRYDTTCSRIPPPRPGPSIEDLKAELLTSLDRGFPDQPLPALDNKSPRQAAKDPALRPKLVRLMKSRVRLQDEENLRTGRTADVNRLLRDLGLDEIIFDPPPPRKPPDVAAEEDEPADEPYFTHPDLRPPAPRLPPAPLTHKEAERRLQSALELFDTAGAAIDEMGDSGATLLTDAHALVGETMTETEFSFLVAKLVFTWFALVPPGVRAPDLDFEAVKEGFIRELKQLETLVAADRNPLIKQLITRLLEGCRQPAFYDVLVSYLFASARSVPSTLRLSPTALVLMALFLKTVVNELDRALRD